MWVGKKKEKRRKARAEQLAQGHKSKSVKWWYLPALREKAKLHLFPCALPPSKYLFFPWPKVSDWEDSVVNPMINWHTSFWAEERLKSQRGFRSTLPKRSVPSGTEVRHTPPPRPACGRHRRPGQHPRQPGQVSTRGSPAPQAPPRRTGRAPAKASPGRRALVPTASAPATSRSPDEAALLWMNI